MPVYVYDDVYKTRCLCVLDDDGKVYDKADSSYNSTPRQMLGNFDYNNRLFYGKDRYDEAGAVDDSGYVYNDMDNMCCATRVGYVYGDRVYDEGPSVSGYAPMSSTLAYMEGDGDMKKAGAAVLLLVLGRGGRAYSSSSYSSSSPNSSSSWSSSDDSGGSGEYRRSYTPKSTAQNHGNKREPLDAGGCLGICFVAAVILIILEKLFG